MRDTIIDIAKGLNIDYQESYLNINELDSIDEAFITSTGIGLLPCYWGDKKFTFDLTLEIKKELFYRINNTNL